VLAWANASVIDWFPKDPLRVNAPRHRFWRHDAVFGRMLPGGRGEGGASTIGRSIGE